MFKCLCTRLAQGDCQGLTIRVAVDDMDFQWPKYLPNYTYSIGKRWGPSIMNAAHTSQILEKGCKGREASCDVLCLFLCTKKKKLLCSTRNVTKNCPLLALRHEQLGLPPFPQVQLQPRHFENVSHVKSFFSKLLSILEPDSEPINKYAIIGEPPRFAP